MRSTSCTFLALARNLPRHSWFGPSKHPVICAWDKYNKTGHGHMEPLRGEDTLTLLHKKKSILLFVIKTGGARLEAFRHQPCDKKGVKKIHSWYMLHRRRIQPQPYPKQVCWRSADAGHARIELQARAWVHHNERKETSPYTYDNLLVSTDTNL